MDFDDRIYISLPAVLKTLLGILLLGLVVLYALFQARHLISGPELRLLEDIPPTIATSSIVVHGIAKNITAITLNGREIYTTDGGVFSETVTLPKGYTMITIEGVDRYGSRDRIERMIVRE